jgi:hypothetical protein
MKILLLLLVISFNAFAVSGVANSYQVGKTLKVASEYLQGTSKVDGSFESSNAAWAVSVGTIVKTASTEYMGANKGVWAGTGTGTLDLLWTATASNTYELTAQVKTTDVDMQVCAYVNGTETGCKAFTASNITKVSVVASSFLGQSFYLRIKHTGSDAFSLDIDDGKIEPWTPNVVGLVTQEEIRYNGYSSGTTGGVKFLTKTKDNSSLLVSSDNSGSYTKFTLLANTCFTANSNFNYVANTSGYRRIFHYTQSGTLVNTPTADLASVANTSQSYTACGSTGDYIYTASPATPANTTAETFFSIVAQATSQNIVRTWEDGTEWTSYTPTFSAGFGTVTGINFKWKRDGSDILIKGYALSGIPAASIATISLPNGLVTSSTMAGYMHGLFGNNAAAGGYSGVVLAQASSTTFGLGRIGTGATNNSTVLLNVNNFLTNSGDPMLFDARIPIQGWSSTPTLLALPVSKQNSFSGNYDGNAIAIVNQPLFVATRNSAGDYTLNYSLLNLTVAPQVDITHSLGRANISALTSTSITFQIKDYSDVNTDTPFYVKVTKNNPDYTAPGVFVGNVSKNQVATIRDYVTAGSGGGTATSGSWLVHTLVDVIGDTSIVSLASNQFTLQAGTYDIGGDVDFFGTFGSSAAIYDVSGATPLLISSSVYAPASVDVKAIFSGTITLTAAKLLELRYKVQNTVATYGLGNNGNNGLPNINAQVKITKLNGN